MEEQRAAVQWTGKSEAMFEIMLGEVPEAMRSVFRGKLLAVIAEKSKGGAVTDEHVNAVVLEIVPEPFKTTILKKFREVGDFDIKKVDAIVARHGASQDKLMHILHEVQGEFGYLPIEALRAISNKCAVPPSTVYSMVTFYRSFRLTPPGKHHVKLCCGTACHLNDVKGVLPALEKRLAGTPAVSYEKTLCLGCCDCAPVIDIDGRPYNADEAQTKIDGLLA